ncbi:MAG TPA: lytic transglycosylase domain-containing protein [Stellaceae bacterium]|nr:lytic transglycosylase domain-containing protein [Stellaceae bacterium]
MHPLVCRDIELAATANRLPVGYLSRLLWTESRFSSAATSPAGAEGVAQFMPETAVEEGLRNPRDPASSIEDAARLLVRLHRRFGNLGLAAAAYNAGPARLSQWLQGLSFLPAETVRYVQLVTGYSVERWVAVRTTPAPAATAQSCAAAIAEYRRDADSVRPTAWRLPLSISSDGELVDRETRQPLAAADRLALHAAIMRAVGLPPVAMAADR